MSAIETTPTVEPAVIAPPAPTPEPAAPAAPVVETPAAKPEDRRAVIAEAFRTSAEKPRDPAGKFVPKPPALPAAAEPVAAVPKVAMPKSLRLELSQHWEKTPAELQAAINQREADYEKGVQPLKQKAQQADELLNEFKPYEAMLRTENATPATAVRTLLQTAAILRTGSPVQKAHAVATTMRQFGIPIEHIQQMLSGSVPAPAQQAMDPQYIQQLVNQQLTAFQQQQLEGQNISEVERFAANPEHKHFAAVQDWMSSLMATERFQQEHGSKAPQDTLKAAYDMALRVDPAIYQQVIAEQQAKETAQRQVTQSKNAAVQVKGAPSSGPAARPDPNNRREVIGALIRAQR